MYLQIKASLDGAEWRFLRSKERFLETRLLQRFLIEKFTAEGKFRKHSDLFNVL